MRESRLYLKEQFGAGGKAPLVVLVHGMMDRHTSFARVRSRLAPSCRVLSYDRRGYALSRDLLPPATGLSDHVQDLAEIVGDRRVTVAGHSYGGTLALALAARRPELVSSLVAYEPPLSWFDWWPERSRPSEKMSSAESAEAFVRRVVGENRYARLPASTRRELALDGEAFVTESRAIRRDPAPFEPSEISCPAIVARGSRARPNHTHAVDLLVAEMKDARLAVVEGAGHNGHQSHPTEFADLVLEAVELGRAHAAEPTRS